MTAGFWAGAAFASTRPLDLARPASQRKRRRNRRDSRAVRLARRLKAPVPHLRFYACMPPSRRWPSPPMPSDAFVALERSGRPPGRARRAETRPYGARFTTDRGCGPGRDLASALDFRARHPPRQYLAAASSQLRLSLRLSIIVMGKS